MAHNIISMVLIACVIHLASGVPLRAAPRTQSELDQSQSHMYAAKAHRRKRNGMRTRDGPMKLQAAARHQKSTALQREHRVIRTEIATDAAYAAARVAFESEARHTERLHRAVRESRARLEEALRRRDTSSNDSDGEDRVLVHLGRDAAEANAALEKYERAADAARAREAAKASRAELDGEGEEDNAHVTRSRTLREVRHVH